MIESPLTARQLWAALQAAPTRRRFGFGRRAALVNVDLQRAYTDLAAFPATAYETDPRQAEHVNRLATLCRTPRLPRRLDPCRLPGRWLGLRRLGHPQRHAGQPAEHQGRLAARRTRPAARHRLDRCGHPQAHGLRLLRDQPALPADLPRRRHHRRSPAARPPAACARRRSRACPAASVSSSPVECTADRHEGPHFANLYDMAVKYADVLPVEEVLAGLAAMPAA